MGESSSDIQREIEQLRTEVEVVLNELETRTREAVDIKAQARRHPRTVGLAALMLFGAVILVIYAIVGRIFFHSSSTRSRKKSGDLFGLAFWPLILSSLAPWAVLAARKRLQFSGSLEEISRRLTGSDDLAHSLQNFQKRLTALGNR